MLASKQYIDELQMKYRNMTKTTPSTTIPIKTKLCMPPPTVNEPLSDLSHHKDSVRHTIPSRYVETMELLYCLMARQGEIFQRQGVLEPKLAKFGGNPVNSQCFMTVF